MNPFEQREQRRLEEAWRHGKAAADRRGSGGNVQRSACCQAEVAKSSGVVVCKGCGKRQK